MGGVRRGACGLAGYIDVDEFAILAPPQRFAVIAALQRQFLGDQRGRFGLSLQRNQFPQRWPSASSLA